MRCPVVALALLLLADCGETAPREQAVAWLCAQQRPDGSFRSAQYAVLRSGQAMTPFVLHALLGNGAAPDTVVERALAFLRESIGDDGAIGYADPELLEYPVYATSLAILVLVRVADPADRERIDRMAFWLVRQQCGEARGFADGAPAYGAFGFGALGLQPGEPGHVDLTHTRFALQALAAAGRLDEAVAARALVLLGRLQNGDGGFSFSPVVAAANKAGRDAQGRFRSYATATADGVLALRALGAAPDDARLVAARAWLERHASGERIGGIGADPSEPWHDALRFYHAMVLAEAHPGARGALHAMLTARQRPDGSFRSDMVTAMKEDDPLLATALALRALAAR
ncbi:MAG TPA: prenyltransferase/squalene oxidase repeat-containing protein [Planctomycetota bacterium]|nr:prenyltransferase/squalene oxidase repeat-containing protein [Planctomycetota bacterium]